MHDNSFRFKKNGGIESILKSLLPIVPWKHNHHPKENSEEAKILEVLEKPKD